MRKLKSILVLLALVLCLSGCTALFSETYRSEKEFQGNEGLSLDSNVQVVQNYAELRRLVFGLMNAHGESLELLFSGYTGNVVSDIASVCNAVKTDSAYGAYCVDYVSYDLRQIVSYYEANITISYKYTQEELEILQTTTDLNGFEEIVARQLEQEVPKAIVKVNNAPSDESTVEMIIAQVMRNHPMAISYRPDIKVKAFSGTSSQKIYEVSVQYDESVENKRRLNEMKNIVDKAVQSLEGETDALRLVSAAQYFDGQYDDYAPDRNTPYHVFVEKTGGSEGIACAYKALCDELGVECTVVSGKAEKTVHFWNIVKIDDAYYHMDVSSYGKVGGEKALFLSDTEKQADYWWDQSAYPDCDGSLRFEDVISK